MTRRISLALLLAIAAGPALAQSEQEVTAAVGKERDAYTSCLKQHVYELAKSSDSEDAIVLKAIASCDAERTALLEGLKNPPLNVGSKDAEAAVKQATEDLKPRMLQTIKDARG